MKWRLERLNMCRKLILATSLVMLAAPAAALAQAAPAPVAEAAIPRPAKASPAERAMADRGEPMARAAFWNQQLNIDPTDIEAGLGLTRALRGLGQYAQAAQTAEQITMVDPNNREALLEWGKARIAEGRAFYGIDPLRRARALDPRDWQAASLLGVAYEQVERHDDAWAAYQEALSLSPENPAVLSNMAMFVAARGQAPEAEAYLRRAVAQPGASVQVRQNLALVLGIQGKLAEAERLLREDLPPEVANNNLAYLRSLSATGEAGGRTWEALRGG